MGSIPMFMCLLNQCCWYNIGEKCPSEPILKLVVLLLLWTNALHQSMVCVNINRANEVVNVYCSHTIVYYYYIS